MMIPGNRLKQGPAMPHADQVDPQDIHRILEAHAAERSALISILGDLQARYRYLPEEALRAVAERTGAPLVDVYAAATFYHSFSLKPKGRHIVLSCQGTACHVRGAPRIAEELQRQLGIGPGETTPDMQFSLETVNCLGACALGPVVVVDGRYFSKVRKSQVRQIIEGALNGFDQVEMEQDSRIFPIEASCPSCRRSLMDMNLVVDGRPSIGLSISSNGGKGRVGLSCLYGSHSVTVAPDIPPDTVADFFCPHCASQLNGSWECSTCGAPMVALDIRGGGQLHVCSRRGCKSRLLDLTGPQSAAAGDEVR